MRPRERWLWTCTIGTLNLNAATRGCVASAAAWSGHGELGMAKGKVGIVGLGIMGGAFAQNLVAAGWRVVGYDIDPARRRTMARAGVEIAPDTKTLAAEVATIITSLPKPAALDATVAAIVDAAGAPARDRRSQHLHDRGQAQGRARVAQGRPCDAGLPGERHRLAGARQGPRDLCERRHRNRSAGCVRCSPASRAPCTTLAHSATAAA